MANLTDIERLNYYEGEFLAAADFQAEQEYHRDMRRRHNLGQHTWGIVTGLTLAQAPNGGTTPSGKVEVDTYLQPGMAVDGFGREIVVLSQTQLTLDMFAAFYDPSANASPRQLCIWIAYQQSLLQASSDACTSMNVSNAFGRVGESYMLSVTAPGATPTNDAIVVDGSDTTPPVEPTTSSSSSSSSGSAPTPNPPPVTLPYDDSVPFQEFSNDDTSLLWWIPLGQVLWDPHNQVFIQINAAAAAKGRDEYAGNVSAAVYAPAGSYTIQDRNAPSPTDPNYVGVKVEVLGSLQVNLWLNAEQNALIGGQYDSSTPLTSPLTIIASAASSTSPSQGLLQFCDPSGNETWHLNQNLTDNTPGLNIGETVADGRLFLQSGGNVGVGTTAPQQNLSVNAGLNIDQGNQNPGGSNFVGRSLNYMLTFGNDSGEAIASSRLGSGKENDEKTNLFGLDFYTDFTRRMFIDHAGNVYIVGQLYVGGVLVKVP